MFCIYITYHVSSIKLLCDLSITYFPYILVFVSIISHVSSIFHLLNGAHEVQGSFPTRLVFQC